MTEQKVKKRGWVKDAAIIFLAVMLALTFFSNTIMNHSLPEVAAQYVQSGAINAKIRGTGTVAANESFEVKSEQAREVLSVPVKVGDEVKVGDTLLLFSDAESTQVKEAQAALDTLVLAYQIALVEASGDSYAKENRDIALAQKALDKAKATRDANAYSASDLAVAEANYNRANNEYTLQQTKVENLTTQLSGLTSGGNNSATYAKIQQANNDITVAKNELASAMLVNGTAYTNLKNYAIAWMTADGVAAANQQTQLPIYLKALNDKFADAVTAAVSPFNMPYGSGTETVANAKVMVAAYKAITDCNNKITDLNSTLAELQASLDYGDWNYSNLKTQLTEANTLLATLKTSKSNYEITMKALQDKQTKFNAADTAVAESQKALEDLMFTLADMQKAGTKASLNLAAQKKQIAEKSEDLAKLQKGGEGASIESKVNGKVASINVSAGKTTTTDTPLMTIEVPDMGYGISISVTNEQSKKVTVGDPAEITNNYSGEELTATLVGIKSDPKNPNTNKLLNFKIQGEVESGSQLAISIGERGGNYDTIVPNSSIRSDNNGKFVLIVLAKNSALGNRYIAQRIDVKVVASDDVNTAVSGAVTNNDMVITTSTKPIEPGTQVRLADG